MNAIFARLKTVTTADNPVITLRLALILSALAGLFGMGLLLYATSAGPGVGGDATIYLTTARNLLNGQGLGWTEADGTFRVLPYTPPFYPLTLSAVGLVARDMTAGARWLNILLAGASALLAGWGFFLATRRAWLAGILAGLLAVSPVLIGVQVWAMSETLFLLAGFAGLGLLLAYFHGGQPRWWLLSALLVGLAALTRYPGVAFIATGALVLLLLTAGPARRRWAQAVRYGLLASLPLAAWLVIDVLLTGSIGSRSGQPADAYWQRLLEFCPALEEIYLFWLLPDSLIARLPGVVRAAAWLIPMTAVIGAWVWLRRGSDLAPMTNRAGAGRGASRRAPTAMNESLVAQNIVIVMALFIAIYLVVLLLTHVFVYPPVTLASRMLSPVHAAALGLLLALAAMGLARLETTSATSNGVQPGRNRSQPPATATKMIKIAPALVYLLLLAVLGSYAARSALIAREYHRTGIGYNSPVWRDAPVLDAVRGLPADVALVSNETTALMYLVDRPAYALQEIFAQQPQAEFTTYGTGDDAAQRAFREQGAALVLFNATLRDDFAMYGDRLEERLAALTRGLRPLYQGEDGAIYVAP